MTYGTWVAVGTLRAVSEGALNLCPMTPAELATTVKEAATRVLAAHDLDASVVPDTVTVERPRNPEHGDYAINIALQVAKMAGTNPRELAGWLADDLSEDPAIDSAEIAGPGFLNVRFDDGFRLDHRRSDHRLRLGRRSNRRSNHWRNYRRASHWFGGINCGLADPHWL